MKRTIILKSPEQFTAVLKALDSIPADTIHEVVIRPHELNLSAAQRRLYWLRITEISKHTGMTKEEAHLEYKRRFLVPIFERDDKDYAEMIEAVREVHRRGMVGHAKHMQKQIIKMTSIMDASTKQMSEYMEDIRLSCLDIGLRLSDPEDIERFCTEEL